MKNKMWLTAMTTMITIETSLSRTNVHFPWVFEISRFNCIYNVLVIFLNHFNCIPYVLRRYCQKDEIESFHNKQVVQNSMFGLFFSLHFY